MIHHRLRVKAIAGNRLKRGFSAQSLAREHDGIVSLMINTGTLK